MSEMLALRCHACGTYQSRSANHNDRGEAVCTCSGCGRELRCDLFDRTRSLYRGLGYDVVEVPVFYEGDVERNNQARIEHICKHAALRPRQDF